MKSTWDTECLPKPGAWMGNTVLQWQRILRIQQGIYVHKKCTRCVHGERDLLRIVKVGKGAGAVPAGREALGQVHRSCQGLGGFCRWKKPDLTVWRNEQKELRKKILVGIQHKSGKESPSLTKSYHPSQALWSLEMPTTPVQVAGRVLLRKATYFQCLWLRDTSALSELHEDSVVSG